MEYIGKINGSADVKALDKAQLAPLCDEIRAFLIDSVSRTGGHLASNLGIVELTVALHRVFDTSVDRLVFDVGHQCYVHKLLTGRADGFDRLRKFGGLSGFPKPCESIHDAFIAGHASNSVSVATGMARARELQGEHYNVIALLGDGALTGGLAYEGLNDAGQSGLPLIVILNDNGMSIAKNVGGVSRYLSRQRLKPGYVRFKCRWRKFTAAVPGGKALYRVTHRIKQSLKNLLLKCSMFEDMGFTYVGPVDGHDIEMMTQAFQYAIDLKAPVLVHVRTIKGKGYSFSEANPDYFHGIGAFDAVSGQVGGAKAMDFSTQFGEALTELAGEEPRLCAITAAMMSSTGLDPFRARYPERTFDVGIAEQHAVALSAGMAARGMLPVAAIYSTFLQRAYDMLIHDVALSGLHVIFGVDRAGLTGGDGATHQGLFDVGFLCQIPHMTVLCPASYAELRTMLRQAVFELRGPVALRYPRGGQGAYRDDRPSQTVCLLREGSDLTLVTYGILVNTALEAAALLERRGISCAVLKLGCIAPLDFDTLCAESARTGRLLVLEDCVAEGCVGQRIAAGLMTRGAAPKCFVMKNCGMRFVEHGSVPELMASLGLDAAGVADAAEKAVNG